MLHLSADRLAELGDATPSPEECAHLAACAACAGERAAFVALVGMAHADRGAMALPLTRWETIAVELERDVPYLAPAAAPLRRPSRLPLQIAAGLLLVAGGAMLGRVSAGKGAFPESAGIAAAPTAADTAQATRLLGDSASFASVDEARAAQARSELLYQQASAFLAQHDSTAPVGSPVAYRSRLAALDRVISTTREALREVPHDPVINDTYLTTIGQREATLRQLNTALPASLRLNSF